MNVSAFGQTNASFVLTSKDEIVNYLDNAVKSDLVSYYEVVATVEAFLQNPQSSVAAMPLPAQVAGDSSTVLNDDEEDGVLAKYSRWKNYWHSRVDSKGSFNTGSSAMRDFVLNGIYDLCENDETKDFHWQNLGPSNNDGALVFSNMGISNIKQNQGRFDCIAIDPHNNDVLLVGTRNGGIFKTINGGITWYNTTDEEGLSAVGMMDIAFHPSNSNYVVASAGNKQRLTSYGLGLIESFDAGETWSLIPQTNTNATVVGNETYYFTDVRIDPRSVVGGHMRIYAMTQDELWVYDNTATNIWTQIYDGPWAPESISGFTDFEFVNGSYDNFYFVTRNKLFSGNRTWNNTSSSIVQVANSYILANVPLGYSNIVQMRLRMDNTNKLILALQIKDGINTKVFINNALHGTLQILNWASFETSSKLGLESFEINKVNTNFMYSKFGAGEFARSIDGGHNWVQLSNGYGISSYAPSMHVDIRYIKVNKHTAMGLDEVYVCTDGGIQKSIDGLNYEGINGEGLSVAQYYKGMAVNQRSNDDVLLGAQDGSINFYHNEKWIETPPGGDNFSCLLNIEGPTVYHQIGNHRYYRYTAGFSSSSSFGNSNFDYYPYTGNNLWGDLEFTEFSLEMSPSNQNRLMIGQFDLYFNDNNGQGSFTKIPDNITNPPSFYLKKTEIDALKISKSNPNISYYIRRGHYWDNAFNGINNDVTPAVNGFDGITGGIFKLEESSPGNFIQTNITNNLAISDASLPSYGPSNVNTYQFKPLHRAGISDIAIDPKNHNRVWITFNGFGSIENSNSFNESIKVFKTENGGLLWENADPTNSLPNFPVNAIQYQEGTNDRIYIGTDVGVFYKDNDMPDWCRYADLPAVNVTDVDINYCTQTLYASTWCRGLWKAPLISVKTQTNLLTVSGSNVIWDEDKFMNQSFRITPGTKLTLDNMTLSMAKNAKIIIDKGARLEINGSTITNNCDGHWEGIEVRGVSSEPNPSISSVIADNYPGSFPSYLNQQGVLIIDNNSIIEHANNAISLAEFNEACERVVTGSGGVVIAKNSTFRNNKRSVEFMRYTADYSSSIFENCKFIVNNDFRFDVTHNFDQDLCYQFTMWDVKGVDILGCKFKDERSNINLQESTETNSIGGIFTIDAGFNLRSYCTGSTTGGACNWKRARFDNLYRAVRVTETPTSSKSVRIDECDIYNVKYGIFLKATNSAYVVRNNIFGKGSVSNAYEAFFPDENGAAAPNITTNSITGIKMEAMNGYNFTENKINKVELGIWGVGIGSNAGANIYNNQISNTKAESALLFYNNSNLQLSCNKFLNNQGFDIRSGGSFPTQGSVNKSTGNTFSISTDHTYLGVSNTTGIIAKPNADANYTYYYTPVTTETPENVSPGILLEPVPLGPAVNTCVARFLQIYDAETGATISSLEDMYLEVLSSGVLDDVPCTLHPYFCSLGLLERKEYALDGLLFLYNKKPLGYNGGVTPPDGPVVNTGSVSSRTSDIINLLETYQTTAYRKVQLASYYTQAGEFTLAANKLNEVQTSSAGQEWKELASLYTINNNLQQQNKTWLDISATDLNQMYNLAAQEDYTMAAIKARNVIELVKGVYYDEGRPEESYIDVNNEVNTEEPLFSLFPNPINGILNISFTETIEEPFLVRIYDLIKNNQVYEGLMESEPFILDVSAWQTGFYSVVILDLNENILFKSSTKIKN